MTAVLTEPAFDGVGHPPISSCRMCTNCALQVWETSVRAGGASGTQALLAAGAASVGARGVGRWLAARGCRVTPARLTIATSLLVTLVIVAVVLASAERVLY